MQGGDGGELPRHGGELLLLGGQPRPERGLLGLELADAVLGRSEGITELLEKIEGILRAQVRPLERRQPRRLFLLFLVHFFLLSFLLKLFLIFVLVVLLELLQILGGRLNFTHVFF